MPKMFETRVGRAVIVTSYDNERGERRMDVEIVGREGEDDEGEVLEYIENLSHTGLTLLAVKREWTPV